MRVLFASTRGAGHFNPLLPFLAAARRAGHEVLVAGPPPLAETVERAGYAFAAGAEPPDEELGPVWAQVPTASFEEAERLVIGEIFATLNVRAMLPALRETVREWRPDVIVREPAEFASAIVAEERSVPHVQVGVSLVSSYMHLTEYAEGALDAWAEGLAGRLVATPYLTTFPASLEDPGVAGPPRVHRFRDDEPPAAEPLADHWPGDDRPLVYVSFGSQAAGVPTAADIYGVALAAVADVDARVLLTTGDGLEELAPPGPHVHVARWVPQADVLPHARVVVCHGGSGTTLGALTAGVPLVITPLFADQPQNGDRVAAVGAGLVVRPRDREAPSSAIDPADLQAAIAAVLADGRYAEGAARIAAEIRALPPADEALSLLA